MTDITSGAVRNWLSARFLQNTQPLFEGWGTPLSLSIPLLSMALISTAQPAAAQGASIGNSGPLLAQAAPVVPPTTGAPPQSTILPTDVLPLPNIQNRMTFGENLQLRILQKLPSRFYFTTSVETSFRMETNPFQDPNKSILARHTFTPTQFFASSPQTQLALINLLKQPNSFDNVYRVLPNVTAGWTLTPNTRFYGNFFMIRDSLFKNVRLNTVIYSYSYGLQHDFKIGSRANLQADVQARNLNQIHGKSIFDFLPGLTLTYIATPRTVAYLNALMQIRGRGYYQAPDRELDPFYTWGILHQRGRWTFSASTTFVQNFREQFGNDAAIKQNNYAFISDYEIARRIIPQISGLQAFVRAEPIWNIHSRARAGLSGFDFRLYYGLRFTASKPALTSALDSLRKQLEEQEVEPPRPQQPAKPSAYILPQEVTAQKPQPIHGLLGDNGQPLANAATNTAKPSSRQAKIAKARSKHQVAAKSKPAQPDTDLAKDSGTTESNITADLLPKGADEKYNVIRMPISKEHHATASSDKHAQHKQVAEKSKPAAERHDKFIARKDGEQGDTTSPDAAASAEMRGELPLNIKLPNKPERKHKMFARQDKNSKEQVAAAPVVQPQPEKRKAPRSAFASAVTTPVTLNAQPSAADGQSPFARAMMFDSSDAQKVVDPDVESGYTPAVAK